MGWGYIPKNFKNDTNKRLFCRGKLQFTHKKVYQICGLMIIKPKKEKKGQAKPAPNVSYQDILLMLKLLSKESSSTFFKALLEATFC